MFKFSTIIWGILLLLVSLNAQDNLPVYSAVQYRILTDSLSKSNEPQDMLISITNSSPGTVVAYELKIYDLKVLWTIVSAKLNDEDLWLVNRDSNPENENVLSWNYDSGKNLLRIYPPERQAGYDLEIMLRLSILQPGLITKSDSKNVSLEADLSGVTYTCLPRESGDLIKFKRKAK